MSFWQYLWAGTATTIRLFHMQWNANDNSGNWWNPTSESWSSYINEWKFWWCLSFATSNDAYWVSYADWGHDWRDATWYTYSTWAKISATSTPTNGCVIWADYFSQVFRSTGTAIDTRDYSWSVEPVINTWTVLSAWVWYNIVSIYDTSYLNLYINWKYIGRSALTSITSRSTWTIWNFERSAWFNQWMKGEIDEVIIEKRARTDWYRRRQYTYAKGRFGIL